MVCRQLGSKWQVQFAETDSESSEGNSHMTRIPFHGTWPSTSAGVTFPLAASAAYLELLASCLLRLQGKRCRFR
jgi:hypothetical protein